MRTRAVCAGAVVLAGWFASPAGGEVFRVRPGCGPGGTPDGLAWETAFCGPNGLHDALAAAGPGDEIWVAAGTYRPAPANGDRNISFVLPAGVSVYGGFAGSETAREQRDPAVFVTRLAGDLNGNDTPPSSNPYPGNANENAYHVVRVNEAGEPVTLDGLTVRSGFALGSSTISGDRGGNILVEGAELVLRGCQILSGYASRAGGGVAAYDATVTVEGCRFRANACNSAGAGLAVMPGSHATIMDTSFEANLAGFGGGVYVGGTQFGGAAPDPIPSVTMRRCVIRDTDGVFGSSSGGAIAVSMGDLFASECDFIDNEVPGGGGAIYAISHTVKVVSCRFFGNSAPGDGGGAVFVSGQSSAPGSTDPEFVNCWFVRNNGVAIANFGGGARFFNCTMANNTIGFGFLSWPALSVTSTSSLTLHNSIVWNNETENHTLFGSGPIVLGTFGGTPVVDIAGCIIEEWNGSIPGDAINADPVFVDLDGADGVFGTPDDDLRLAAGSPAIDAGLNASVPADAMDLDGDADTGEPTALDLDGRPRFVDDPGAADTGSGTAPIVDIGAYERGCAPDLTEDGVLNFFDIAAYIAVYQTGTGGADWNGDGIVNFFDIADYLGSYQAGCP